MQAAVNLSKQSWCRVLQAREGIPHAQHRWSHRCHQGTGSRTWLSAENHSGPFPGNCSLPLGSLLPLMWGGWSFQVSRHFPPCSCGWYSFPMLARFWKQDCFFCVLDQSRLCTISWLYGKAKKNKTKKPTNLNAKSKHPEMGRGEGTLKKIMKSSFPKTPEHEADTYLNNTHTILKEKDRWGNALKSHS